MAAESSAFAVAPPSSDITRARGRVLKKPGDGTIVFAPSGTNYEIALSSPNYNGPLNTLIEGTIVAKARKVFSVPSGGNFISPIFGSPRTIQGRVRQINGNRMILNVGTNVIIELPEKDSAVDLAVGPITIGSIVNVMALPGARFEA